MPTKCKIDLPPGVNDVDMDEQGDRRGPVNAYGPYLWSTVLAILKAWDVRDYYIINRGPDGKPPPLTYDSGPRLLALFGDGLWRYTTFGGINGPPRFYCQWADGVQATTGKIAQLINRVYSQAAEVHDLEERLRAAVNRLDTLRRQRDDAVAANEHEKAET